MVRRVSKNYTESDKGYIVGYNEQFVVFQEVYDFKFGGFLIFPIAQIEEVQHGELGTFYDKVLENEGIKGAELRLRGDMKFKTWNSLFNYFKDNNKAIIVECEHPKIDLFVPGKVMKATKKRLYIRYFNVRGILENYPTDIKFKHITKVVFDDFYVDTLNKYLRIEEETDTNKGSLEPFENGEKAESETS